MMAPNASRALERVSPRPPASSCRPSPTRVRARTPATPLRHPAMRGETGLPRQAWASPDHDAAHHPRALVRDADVAVRTGIPERARERLPLAYKAGVPLLGPLWDAHKRGVGGLGLVGRHGVGDLADVLPRDLLAGSHLDLLRLERQLVIHLDHRRTLRALRRGRLLPRGRPLRGSLVCLVVAASTAGHTERSEREHERQPPHRMSHTGMNPGWPASTSVPAMGLPGGPASVKSRTAVCISQCPRFGPAPTRPCQWSNPAGSGPTMLAFLAFDACSKLPFPQLPGMAYTM